MLIIRVSETLSAQQMYAQSIPGQGAYLPYTRYSCSFTLSSSCSSPSPGPPAPSLRGSNQRSRHCSCCFLCLPARPDRRRARKRGAALYPYCCCGGRGRGRGRPPLGSWHPIIIVFALGRKRRDASAHSIITLGHVTKPDRYIHLHRGNCGTLLTSVAERIVNLLTALCQPA